MTLTILELALSAIVIVVAAALFTNAVEILGDRLDLDQGSIGSVLAAVGTALPETMIPIVAVISIIITGNAAAGEVGVGAILGAPFLLATLAMFVVAVSIQGFRRRRETDDDVAIDKGTAQRDLLFFLVFFALGVGAGLVPLPFFLKVVLAVVLVVAYGLYVWRTIRSGGESIEEPPEKLALWRTSSEAPMWAVAAQLLGTVAVMGAGAHFFVTAVEHLSEAAGLPAGLIALVLAPLATELPEKFNSVIWLRGNKDTLALGNITGGRWSSSARYRWLWASRSRAGAWTRSTPSPRCWRSSAGRTSTCWSGEKSPSRASTCWAGGAVRRVRRGGAHHRPLIPVRW